MAVAPIRIGQTAVVDLEGGYTGHRLDLIIFLRRCNGGHRAQPELQGQGRGEFLGKGILGLL